MIDLKRNDRPAQEASGEPAVWEFRDGQLVASDWEFWRDDREEPDEALTRHGFYEHASIRLGDELDAVSVEIHTRLCGRHDWPGYLAELTIAGDVSLVALGSLPSLLDFLSYVAPLIESLARLAERAERIQRELEAERRPARLRAQK